MATVSEKARFRSSVFEYSTAKVIDETSTVQYSSKIAVEEYPSGARSCSMVLNSRKHSALFMHLGISENEEEEEIEDYRTTPPKKVGDSVTTALYSLAASHNAEEPTSLVHARWTEQAGEADSVKVGKAIVDARGEVYGRTLAYSELRFNFDHLSTLIWISLDSVLNHASRPL